MNHTTESFEAYLQVFFQLHPRQKKFESSENTRWIVERMRSYGLGVVSDTMVQRAIQELLAEGQIHRADGGDESTDRRAAEVAERNRISAIAARPLTEKDFNEFVRMTPAELEQKYFGDAEFRIRYDVACKQWGFRAPLPPPKPIVKELHSDTLVECRLTAKQYHALSSAEIIRRYRDPSQPQFRKDVDRLISRGEI